MVVKIQQNNYSDKYDDISPQNHVNPEYHAELNLIREQVKNGHCDTLKECLLLYEEFLDENHQYEMVISHNFQKEMDKLSVKNPEQFKYVLKKMEQIQAKPNHYKPLSGDLQGARRTHVGDFVLIYELKNETIFFHDYDHHDRIYKKGLKKE